MTVELIIMVAFGGAVGLSSFVAALWSALESALTLAHLQKEDTNRDSIVLAKLMFFRSGARAFLILVLSSIAVIRLTSSELLVTTTTYAMFTLLLIAQVIVALFVLLDVYERTSILPGYSTSEDD